MVVPVGDEQIPESIHGHVIGGMQHGSGGGPAVASIAALPPAARDGGDGATGHFADAVIVGVRDEKSSGSTGGQAVGIVETSGGGGAGVAGKAVRAIARHGRDGTAGVHLADTMVK